MAKQYDLYFQSLGGDNPFGTKPFVFGQARTLGIAGLQKLVNMFTKYLLTAVGSDPLNPEMGTILPTLIGSNVDADDVEEILHLAVEKTVSALIAIQGTQSTPDEEALTSASVTDFLHIPSLPGFSAQIYIQNVAGEGLTFLLPALIGGT
jgi:hypothetical protein